MSESTVSAGTAQADAPDGILRVAQARVETTKANRYLKALCNHFARKVTASYDEADGWVQFAFGACELQAEADALRLTVSADSEAAFAHVKHVVADHLIRFGGEETLRVHWVDAEV